MNFGITFFFPRTLVFFAETPPAVASPEPALDAFSAYLAEELCAICVLLPILLANPY